MQLHRDRVAADRSDARHARLICAASLGAGATAVNDVAQNAIKRNCFMLKPRVCLPGEICVPLGLRQSIVQVAMRINHLVRKSDCTSLKCRVWCSDINSENLASLVA